MRYELNNTYDLWYKYRANMIKWIVNKIVNKSKKTFEKREKELGYTLEFNHLPQTWIQNIMKVDISKTWKRQGLNARGIGLFTIGNIDGRNSTRYQIKSPYFQAWVGGYVFITDDSTEWNKEKIWELPVADQISWLKYYGNKNPRVNIVYESAKELEEIEIDGKKATLYTGDFMSDTDMGNSYALENTLMYAFAQRFNEDKKQLLIPEFLKTYWDKNLGIDEYANIRLRGYIALVTIDEEKNIKALVYANGAIFKDNEGNQYNTFDILKDEFLEIIKNTKFRKI